ncbi:P-loop NTPase fold protein [Methanococcus maripaludis]|uniref:Putative KAP-like P-loop ATPase n=1 Tax=Methanococcus maripaludis TaxID=39152 RepID=A0A7J9PTH9_METMI|nr:P-loop NTPase fold protein [Methanococcus maripaludis]MBA2868877.1 putative KAP-like P-loop ATPase [Methanococcus maripaludis]
MRKILGNPHGALSDSIAKEDKLDRKEFHENLGNLLLHYENENNDGLVIGLYGEWGSGKSTIIDMTKKYVNTQMDELKGYDKPVIFIDYNPWYFSDHDLLISKFFEKLSKELGRKERSEIFGNASELLDKLSKVSTPLKFIPAVSEFAKCSGEMVNSFKELFGKISEEYMGDFEGIKNEINDILKLQDQKIVVVIDDIDRLNSAEVRQIFQLAKCLADFKNVIYILSFDQKIVSKALDKSQDGYGEQYLEKIIQLPIKVPLAHKSALKRMIDEGILNITEIDFKTTYGKEYWDAYVKSFYYLVNNVRDVKRFLNVLRINWNLVKEKDINPLDFVTITSIQVFIPKLYELIKNKKIEFVGHAITEYEIITPRNLTQEHSLTSDPRYQNYCRDYFWQIIPNMLNNYDKYDVYDLLDILFPVVGLNKKSVPYDPQWSINKKICSEDNFENYFMFGNSKFQVPDNYLELLISKKFSKEEFIELIQNFNLENKLIWYLSKLDRYIEKIPSETVTDVIEALLDIELYANLNDIGQISDKIDSYIMTLVNKHDVSECEIGLILDNSHSVCTVSKLHEKIDLKEQFKVYLGDNKYSYIPYYNYFVDVDNYAKAEVIFNYLVDKKSYTSLIYFLYHVEYYEDIFRKIVEKLDVPTLDWVFKRVKSQEIPPEIRERFTENIRMILKYPEQYNYDIKVKKLMEHFIYENIG